MYCRKCGKEIGEDSFCKYCGEAAQEGLARKGECSSLEMLKKIREKLGFFGHEELIHTVSWIGAIAGVVNRFMHNEVDVVYSGFAQDDYFVLAEKSRGFAITILVIQIILCALLMLDMRKCKPKVGKGVYVSFVVALLIQIVAMMLRIPAPY